MGLPWRWFVWVDSLTGPSPQAWSDCVTHTRDGKDIPVLVKHEMTIEDQSMGLEQLAVKYPYVSPSDAEG